MTRGAGGVAGVGDQLPAAAAQLRLASPIRSERPAFDLHHPEVEGILSQSVVEGLVGSGSGTKGVEQ
jgi:hypothetical protein